MNLNVFSKLKNNREAKNASWIIAGRIFQMLLSFVISVFTARYLGSANFGIINYANAYVAFFTSFCTLGMNSVIIKEFVDSPEKQGETVGTVIGYRIISSLLSAIMIIAVVSIVDKGDSTIIVVAGLCSLSLVFQAVETFHYWFQFRYESKTTAMATLTGYVLISLYKTVLLILRKNVVWFAAASAIDHACIAFLLYTAYRRAGGPRLSFSWQRGKEILAKSYHYIWAGMMVAIYGQTDKLMLKHMMDESAVGYYSLATSINGLWTFVLSAIIDSMYPTIIRLHSIDYKAYLRKNRQLYAIVIYVSIVVGVLFVLFGEWAIQLLYGAEYVMAAAPLKVITWYTIFSYLGVARNAWNVCENKQKYLKYMYPFAAVINVGLNMLMIPRWGAVGAATASLITQIFTSIGIPYLLPAMRPNAKLMVDAFLLRKIK